MKRLIIFLLLLMIATDGLSEEIDGEVNIAFVDPYDRLAPGFCLSYRPDFLKWKGLSLGGGLGMYISSRFSYETTDAFPIETDSTKVGWEFFNEYLMELINFEFFAEARWQLSGRHDDAQWKSWFTLNGGAIIHSGVRTRYQTQFFFDEPLNTITHIEKYYSRFKTRYRTDFYLAPGILIGIGNFTVGYRHWLYTNAETLELGYPGRTLGSLRLGRWRSQL